MKLPQEWLYDSILDKQSNEEYGLKFIESTDKEVGHKSNSEDFIFEYQGKFYSITVIYCGSDFRGWDRYTEDFYTLLRDADEIECHEVFKEEVITYKWTLMP